MLGLLKIIQSQTKSRLKYLMKNGKLLVLCFHRLLHSFGEAILFQ